MAAKEMYGNLGQSRDFSLLAGTGTERTVGVAVKPGSGLLARGTIIQMGADGLYVPAETGKMADGACAVLESDTQTGSEVKGSCAQCACLLPWFLSQGQTLAQDGKTDSGGSVGTAPSGDYDRQHGRRTEQRGCGRLISTTP